MLARQCREARLALALGTMAGDAGSRTAGRAGLSDLCYPEATVPFNAALAAAGSCAQALVAISMEMPTATHDRGRVFVFKRFILGMEV